MQLPFVTKKPTRKDVEHLRLLLSVFRDGSGEEKDRWGRTRAGWKQIERIIAEMLNGVALEQKAVYDIVLRTSGVDKAIGISMKTKSLSRNRFEALAADGRVHMELTNAHAQLWKDLKARGLNESNFHPKASDIAPHIGESLLSTVQGWFSEFSLKDNGEAVSFNLDKGKFLVISYTDASMAQDTFYQVHSFPLRFPEGVIWKFHSEKCLRGYDPHHPEEVLFEWYGLSRGQLKY